MTQKNQGKNFTAHTQLEISPFFKRTSQLNQSQEWRRWGGRLAATQYGLSHENEYFAIRTKAALLDISPLYKYSIEGPDALLFLDRLVTRNIQICKIGQIMYTPWCDENGKVIDDGTVQRLGEESFRLTSAEPNLTWLIDNAIGMDVFISDDSRKTSALALQGPHSREILNTISSHSLDGLKFFWLIDTELKGLPVTISRTGYTGDLGYEIWINTSQSIKLWDIIMEAGNSFGITPTGLHALDMSRIEAALILLDVDYISSRHALIDSRKSSPYELGLGWTVKLKKGNFIGKQALEREKSLPSKWVFRGIEIQWEPIEAQYKKVGLAPDLPRTAWRTSTPLYYTGKQVGYATSGCWSPIMKRYIALAHILAEYGQTGTALDFEMNVEHFRQLIPAVVVETPFFNPERKRLCPE